MHALSCFFPRVTQRLRKPGRSTARDSRTDAPRLRITSFFYFSSRNFTASCASCAFTRATRATTREPKAPSTLYVQDVRSVSHDATTILRPQNAPFTEARFIVQIAALWWCLDADEKGYRLAAFVASHTCVVEVCHIYTSIYHTVADVIFVAEEVPDVTSENVFVAASG